MTRSELDGVAARIVDNQAAPAAACAVGFRRGNDWKFEVGAAGTYWPTSTRPVTSDAVFDLASLTKPVVAIAVATESAQGGFALEMPLAHWLPELQSSWAGNVTVESLLAHRSGLLPHLELYRELKAGRQWSVDQLLRTAANATQPAATGTCEPTTAVYSDLGYLLVGAAIERHFAQPLDHWIKLRLAPLAFDGLGSVRTWSTSTGDFRIRCVPTEVSPWRGSILCGRVHDENAWALGGFGMCGHAGLFGTALGVARFGAAVLDAGANRPSVIAKSAVDFAKRSRSGGSLGAGFDRKSPQGSAAGSLASPDTFGHLGFTGTSFWCDPERGVVTVLLSNRVCPNRANIALRTLRPVLHDALFAFAFQRQAD